MKNPNAASSKILIAACAILVLVLAFGGYYYWKISSEEPLVSNNINVATTDQKSSGQKSLPKIVGNIYQPVKPAPTSAAESASAPVATPKRDLQDLSQPSLVNMTLTEATTKQIKGVSVFNKKENYYFNLNSKTEIFFYQAPKLNSDKTYAPAEYAAKKFSDLKKGQRVSVRFDKAVKPYEAARVEILDNL